MSDQRSAAEDRREVLKRSRLLECMIEGVLGERIGYNLCNWLYVAPAANPAMLQMFHDRNRTPRRDMVPWAGEFAGKYLISAVQALRLTKDPKLAEHLGEFVAELIAAQDVDGYMGPFPDGVRMVGPGLWDLWGQYHVMLGLLYWYEETGDENALAACWRCAEYFCQFFLDGGRRVLEAGSEEKNLSCLHIFALLYHDNQRYAQMAHEILRDWETPEGGGQFRAALAGVPFFQTPKPRWERLHAIQGLAEIYMRTGDENCRRAFEQIWWSILESDRHNNGAFSSAEKATGNPYDPRAIETCCTIAWMTMTQDYLRLTGNSRAADELELSTFNAVLGAQNATGRWWTYNTPMDGERKASAHDIVFQARAGSPELNCCSVNGPRGLGILSEWAVMQAGNSLVLNYYGRCEFRLAVNGQSIKLRQDTDYPKGGRIRLTVTPKQESHFQLRLRIPGWSRKTRVSTIEGEVLAEPGTYLFIDRVWKPGDVMEMDLDLSTRLWVGEQECVGKVSLYHGPILMAYDPRFDRYDPTALPTIDPAIAPELVEPPAHTGPPPLLLRRYKTVDGQHITLCDYASAGAAGNFYISWLPAKEGLKPAAFSRENPLRMVWPI
jgi:DUF1680 family protein